MAAITKTLLEQVLADAQQQEAQARELLAIASGAQQIARFLLAELEKPEPEPAEPGQV